MHAYGLTGREREVVSLVLRGYSTKQAAAGLRIAEATVQQHLKAIFDKTGSSSRGELAARILAGQYQPRIQRGLRVASSGWFR